MTLSFIHFCMTDIFLRTGWLIQRSALPEPQIHSDEPDPEQHKHYLDQLFIHDRDNSIA